MVFFDNFKLIIPMKLVIVILLFACFAHQIDTKFAIHLHTHSWCPPCKKAKAIFQKLQKSFPQLSFKIHKYTNKTLIYANSTNSSLPYPTIAFECGKLSFRYQNDLTLPQLSYWIQVACLRKIPECNDKINNELYRILMERIDHVSDQLLEEIMKHPHIKICSSHTANITSQKTIQVLKDTDSKTLYFDYFSNNIRNYLMQSHKVAIAILTTEKNTSRVNSYLHSYISLQNFMADESVNQTDSIYRYQLPQQYKKKLVFLELCFNANISKCIFRAQRKAQVQNNQKMIEKLLHFFDMPSDNHGISQQIVAFKFEFPIFEKHIYHNFGVIDEKFLFWINQIVARDTNKAQKKVCYWNTVTHRVSQNSLEDIQSHTLLEKYITTRSKKTDQKPFPLNKIVSNYHSQAKITLCIEGKGPIHFKSNKQIESVIAYIQAYDEQSSPDQL